MSMNSSALSRRGFIKTATLASATVAFPRILRAQSGVAPSARLNVALVGNGVICGGHANALVAREEVRVVAVCDVALAKARTLAGRIEKHYAGAAATGSFRGVGVYRHHETMLAQEDIDVVFVCTPDHWHAAISHDAMIAGKDVYCEKPLTLTVREGRTLVNTARRLGRVLQAGTQQRSNRSFRRAAEIVRNGLIGDIEVIRANFGRFAPPPDLGEQPIPEGFDYDRWLGQAAWRPYHADRVSGGGWRRFLDYGGRMNGDWGAHHFDIVQWALGMDDSGPVEFIPKGFDGTPRQTHIYASGVRVERVEEMQKAMIEFVGTKGTVWVSRDDYLETDPPELATRPPSAGEVHLYASDNHHDDFFACVRSRQRPIADVEIGHRTATVCHLNNIAEQVGRPIRWDPAKEEIVGDPSASALLSRSRRAPYGALL